MLSNVDEVLINAAGSVHCVAALKPFCFESRLLTTWSSGQLPPTTAILLIGSVIARRAIVVHALPVILQAAGETIADAIAASIAEGEAVLPAGLTVIAITAGTEVEPAEQRSSSDEEASLKALAGRQGLQHRILVAGTPGPQPLRIPVVQLTSSGRPTPNGLLVCSSDDGKGGQPPGGRVRTLPAAFRLLTLVHVVATVPSPNAVTQDVVTAFVPAAGRYVTVRLSTESASVQASGSRDHAAWRALAEGLRSTPAAVSSDTPNELQLVGHLVLGRGPLAGPDDSARDESVLRAAWTASRKITAVHGRVPLDMTPSKEDGSTVRAPSVSAFASPEWLEYALSTAIRAGAGLSSDANDLRSPTTAVSTAPRVGGTPGRLSISVRCRYFSIPHFVSTKGPTRMLRPAARLQFRHSGASGAADRDVRDSMSELWNGEGLTAACDDASPVGQAEATEKPQPSGNELVPGRSATTTSRHAEGVRSVAPTMAIMAVVALLVAMMAAFVLAR